MSVLRTATWPASCEWISSRRTCLCLVVRCILTKYSPQWLPLKHGQSHAPSSIRGPPIATTQEQGPRHQEVFSPLLMPRLITGYGCTYYCCRSGGSKACGLLPWTLRLRVRRTALRPRRTRPSTILHRHWPTVRYCQFKTYCSHPKFRHPFSPTWDECRYFTTHTAPTPRPAACATVGSSRGAEKHCLSMRTKSPKSTSEVAFYSP